MTKDVFEHFDLREFINKKDEQALNTLTFEAVGSLACLVGNVLHPLREHFCCPVIITSGYRSPDYNRKVGGVSNSQHCLGEAVDFYVKGCGLQDVYSYIQNSLPYDQLGINVGKWFIHVSCKPILSENRHQIIHY